MFQHLRDLPEDIHRKELQSVFPTIGDTLAHIYIVDNVWLSAMSGESETIYSSLPVWQEEVKDATVSAFQTCFAKATARYESFFERQTDLEAISEYPHPTHGTLRASYSDVLQHVVNHGTYHDEAPAPPSMPVVAVVCVTCEPVLSAWGKIAD